MERRRKVFEISVNRKLLLSLITQCQRGSKGVNYRCDQCSILFAVETYPGAMADMSMKCKELRAQMVRKGLTQVDRTANTLV